MHDRDRTIDGLHAELERLRGRIAELEALWSGERRAQEAWGRRAPVEVRAMTIPYLGGPAVLSVARDITERRKSEEILRRRTQGLATLLEVSKSLAATLDLETVLQATTGSAQAKVQCRGPCDGQGNPFKRVQ